MQVKKQIVLKQLVDDLTKKLKDVKELTREEVIIFIISKLFCGRTLAKEYLDVAISLGYFKEVNGKILMK